VEGKPVESKPMNMEKEPIAGLEQVQEESNAIAESDPKSKSVEAKRELIVESEPHEAGDKPSKIKAIELQDRRSGNFLHALCRSFRRIHRSAGDLDFQHVDGI